MLSEGDQHVQAAIQQLQQAFEYSKKQKSEELKTWQKRIEDLEQQLSYMQQNLQRSEEGKAKAEAELNNALAMNENLKAQNQALMQALQDKEEEINRFLSLNQSLKNIVDQIPYVKSDTTSKQNFIPQFSQEPKTSLQNSSPQKIEAKPQSYIPSQTQSQQVSTRNISPIAKSPPKSTTRTASKSSQFIKAAKEELSPADFNHMISEINLYNKRNQTREETIANVKRLLGAAHSNLFDQFLPMVSGK
ncbi:hypothetical protein TVAG_499600 [Trichomonas vaginalis G3]|uniref:At4g15545-like C-terminal domain-containing protein n=1 Tax=Trichomonas vaginalis (strain ATCC PRA-98 / G3) TaxID=412133 RepID=A2EIP6_TRIV3|nr:hypothetical protein TVAGG3_0959980 [Trichomonas vaginalis G3]EAY07473.1 hypothetical protein TVAG_499600 [Trichomonas vaginalis G3]KAI5487831.1 hypothetical protein TVAGG3_0959980 [Trichomonas vaginalis G3]|eukprot:XP_001319696.1 hypothetical protein [Trichomonas vaginalis G3]